MLHQLVKLKRLRLLTVALVACVFIAWELVEHFVLPEPTPLVFLVELLALGSLLSALLYILFGVLISVYSRLEVSYRELVSLRSYQASLLESSPYAIIAVDGNDRVTSFNEQAGSISGRHAAEVIGIDVAELFADRATLRRSLRGARRNTDVEWIGGISLATPQGAEIPVAVTLRRISPDDGDAGDCVLIIEDLRERERLERRLIISERLAAATQLAVGLAHATRNPLASLRINLKNLRDSLEREGLGTVGDGFFAAIEAELGKISRLVDSFIRHAVPRASEPGASACPVGELLSAALDSCEGLIEEKHIDLVCNVPGNSFLIDGDRRQLTEAIANVIQNAAEASQDAGRLEIDVRAQGRWVLIEVRDDGCGISSDDLRRVLDFCFTTKPNGLGVGLSFASLTIEQHGGSVEIESELGKGTCVSIRLPCRSGGS